VGKGLIGFEPALPAPECAPTRATSRRGRHAGRPAHRRTRTPRPANIHQSVRGGTTLANRHPRPLPSRHAPHARRLAALTCAARPMASAPYPAPPCCPWRPCLDPYVRACGRAPLLKARAPTKGLDSPPRALPPHTEPPLQPPLVLTVNSTPGRLHRQHISLLPALGPQ
jgi:hypothetical protein